MENLFDLLERSSARRTDHPALVLAEAELSHAELRRRALTLAAGLETAGVRAGDRVGIHLRKSFEEVVATLAVARIGAVFVNVNYQWTPHQLAFVAQDCGLRALVTDGRKLRTMQDPESVPTLICTDEPPAGSAGSRALPLAGLDAGEPAAALPRRADDLAALLYTSGSTGRPKGVMVTHRNLLDGAEIVSGYVHNTPGERVLSLLPLSFDYGLNQLTSMLLVGGTLVLQPVHMPVEIVKTIQRQRVTGLPLVPPSWIGLARYLEESGERLPSLRYATNTGGKIPDGILERIPELLPGVDFYLMYGLTEAFRSTYLEPAEFDAKRGSIGRAIPGVEIFVVDPEKGLCAPGQTGELVHRGKLVSRGYWGDPEKTAQRIRPCPALGDRIGNEAVVFSGDLVRADEDGVLWFEGRTDAMIKCSGYRISPTEVEEILHTSGLVGDVVAFGVEDLELGQRVHVAVTAHASSSSSEPLDRSALLRHCRANMPSYMVPATIHLWPGSMPRTASGKFDRPAIVAGCLDSTPESSS